MITNKLLRASLCVVLFASQVGCIKSQRGNDREPFSADPLESCLALVIDMSGSFEAELSTKAYPLLMELCENFFTAGAGTESRIVICQLSGTDKAVLFEGRPDELRSAFDSPEALATFLRSKSDPGSSQVYQATGKAVSYVTSMPRVSSETRLMTVILSDMIDSEARDPERSKHGNRMLASLKRYRELGGGLALYYVDEDEASRWSRILNTAGFEPASYVIESTLVARPQLPSFD